MKLQKKQKQPFKKYLTIAIISVVAIVFCVTVYGLRAKEQGLWPFTTTATQTEKSETINFDPPTDAEIRNSQEAKKNGGTTESSKAGNQVDSKPSTVSVAISYVGIDNKKLEVRAFIPGAIEGSGTCTATVSNGTKTISGASAAFIDASSSICEPIYIDMAQQQKGAWQVTVSYSSPDSKGISESTEVTNQ